MTDHLTRHTASDPPYDAGPTRWRAERLRAGWPAVHVESVASEPRAGGRQVRAVVRLGALTPADVCVGVTRAAAAEALIAASADCGDDERMWSCAGYGDGRFLFERLIRADADGDDWVVHVRPTDPRAARPVLYPLRMGARGSRG